MTEHEETVEDLLRRLAPQVLGALARRHGQFDACEDAVQEALLAAATSWPDQGRPDNPFTWLHTVAARRLIDHLRADRARREREDRVSAASPASEMLAPPPDEARADSDDSLTLLFLCCHPALTPPTQIALTLRAVGGLTTAEIAAAFLLPEATMAQRISRAKSRVKAAGARFTPPPPDERAENLRSVLQVLYLIFNEGYTSSAGEGLQRVDLTGEAIRLARLLVALIPDDGEALGLLALMLLTDARRDTRVDAGGDLIPLTDQDRARWDADRIAEGVALLSDALSRCPLGVYQLQAAIVAVHDEADRRRAGRRIRRLPPRRPTRPQPARASLLDPTRRRQLAGVMTTGPVGSVLRHPTDFSRRAGPRRGPPRPARRVSSGPTTMDNHLAVHARFHRD